MSVIININDARWNDIKLDYSAIVKKALVIRNTGVEVSVTLTNDAEIRALNKQYRGMDKATNVLSFETGDSELLGDIFLSYDTIMKEFEQAQKNPSSFILHPSSFQNHVAHLLVHGALHLQGYDHLNETDAEKMESTEIKILKKMGIANPYTHVQVPFAGDAKCPGGHFSGSDSGVPRSGGVVGQVRNIILFILLGCAASFGFAPYYFWPLTLLSIGLAYYFILVRPLLYPLSFILYPFLWGAGYGLMSFSWALSSISANDELFRQFWWFYPFGFLFIGIGSGLVFALPFWMTGYYIKTREAHINSKFLILNSQFANATAFALSWTFVLWLREWFLTGFPWNPLANIWINFPIGQSMSVIGALGLTFITVLAIASAAEFIKSRSKKILLLALPLVLSKLLTLNSELLTSNSNGKAIRVRVIQPAFDMNMKVNNSYVRGEIINKLIQLSTADGIENIDLVIWPETAFPYAINSTVRMPALGVPLVTGSTYIENRRVYNAMVLADKDGHIVDVFKKFHLVPFGEFSPFNILPTPANLARGPGPKTMTVGDATFVPAICYEIIFSDSLLPPTSYLLPPNFILNITNDAWFGTSSGPHQHLDMARRQAIETGLPVVRANYGGISAVIDSRGQVLYRLDLGVRGAFDANVPGAHMTIYRRIGLNGIMLMIIIICTPFLIRRRKKRIEGSETPAY